MTIYIEHRKIVSPAPGERNSHRSRAPIRTGALCGSISGRLRCFISTLPRQLLNGEVRAEVEVEAEAEAEYQELLREVSGN
jgi:hypothetical protein